MTTQMTKLQKRRTDLNMDRHQLAEEAAQDGLSGSVGHILLTIVYIETGQIACPKPRKTYEWKSLASVLQCEVIDIYQSNDDLKQIHTHIINVS